MPSTTVASRRTKVGSVPKSTAPIRVGGARRQIRRTTRLLTRRRRRDGPGARSCKSRGCPSLVDSFMVSVPPLGGRGLSFYVPIRGPYRDKNRTVRRGMYLDELVRFLQR